MKKALALLLALALLALPGCGGDSPLYGEVVAVEGEYLLLRGEEGDFALRLSEGTQFLPPDDMDSSAAQASPVGLYLAIYRPQRSGSVETGGGNIRLYESDLVTADGWLERGAMTLSDGTAVDVMHRGIWGDYYRLVNGTELLRFQEYTVSPGADGISDTAAERISAYYEGPGLRCDLSELVESAYADYLDGGDFSCHSTRHQPYMSAVSERVLYFCTEFFVTDAVISENSLVGTTYMFGDAFDRETGERLDIWSLFTVPEDEARSILAAAAGGEDAAGIAGKLGPDNIIVYDTNITLFFPPEAISGSDTPTLYIADLEELPDGLFQSWALPAPSGTSTSAAPA